MDKDAPTSNGDVTPAQTDLLISPLQSPILGDVLLFIIINLIFISSNEI